MRKAKKLVCGLLTMGLLATSVAGAAFAEETKAGQWKKNSKGWWYAYSDGSYAKSEWQKISGKWYYFDGAGYMATGWNKIGGKWYFLQASGAMKTGWLLDGGKWYYLNSNGAMATGWKKVDGEWYFLNSSGAMATGWKKSGGEWYYLDPESGAMYTGWLTLGDDVYYLSESGAMVTGMVVIDGAEYTFNENGVCVDRVDQSPADPDLLPGGWTDITPTFPSEEAQAVFEKATKNLMGATYELMASMGTQIVSGTNYRFLTKETMVTAQPVTFYAIMEVYQDLQGNVEVMSIQRADEVRIPTETSTGGYKAPESIFLSSNDVVIDKALKAFDAAMEYYLGVEYKPLAVLETQLVAGMNYRILCAGRMVTAESTDRFFAIVTIYAPIEGNPTVSEIVSFDGQ